MWLGIEQLSSLWQIQWLKNGDGFYVNSISENSSIGYFFEVDIDNPNKLHELHNDDPLALEKLAASSDMSSKHCKEVAEKYEIKVGDVKRLIPNLGNKTNYVAHYRNLQFYLSLGIKLTKFHKSAKI